MHPIYVSQNNHPTKKKKYVYFYVKNVVNGANIIIHMNDAFCFKQNTNDTKQNSANVIECAHMRTQWGFSTAKLRTDRDAWECNEENTRRYTSQRKISEALKMPLERKTHEWMRRSDDTTFTTNLSHLHNPTASTIKRLKLRVKSKWILPEPSSLCWMPFVFFSLHFPFVSIQSEYALFKLHAQKYTIKQCNQ